MIKYNNPILKGFYPDPSICRVEDDYYMVTSTFTYFPGVPIFHSKDMVHWNQIGNVLDRPSQIPLSQGKYSVSGIFAPTLRYNKGKFYLITTNVANGGNFIVTSSEPTGPWSEPYYLDAEGIDPSLYFEEDRCYYCGTKDRRNGPRFYGDNEIYIQELDIQTMKMIGESYPAWHGALNDVRWPEGPHIYKRDGWYYLLISEGGTGHEHAISIARSRSLFEPFEGYECNPILTHRHLGRQYPIVNVGHPDIVETQNGEWWMVLLASRTYGGYYRNIGRETFLVPFIWENGWPVINPGVGKIEMTGQAPNLPYYEHVPPETCEDFNDDKLAFHFMYLRNPDMNCYSLADRGGYLRLQLSNNQLNGAKSPTFLCQRQRTMSYTTQARMEFEPNEDEFAGICLFQSNCYYYAFGITKKDQKTLIQLRVCTKGIERIIASRAVNLTATIWDLKVHAHGQSLSFSYKEEKDEEYKVLEKNVDARILSTDVAGGFVGTCIGLFGVCEETKIKNHVDFDWFKLVGLDD